MDLLNLDPRLIQWPENRVTAYYQEGQEELLKQSLSVMGQQQPIVVVKVGDAYFGVDGLHRCQSAIDRRLETIPCVVKEGDEKDVLFSNLVLNSLRGRTKASEMVAVLGELFEDKGVTIEELVDRTGHPQEWVEKHITVSRATTPVRQALDDELITLGHAYALARIENTEVQERVCYNQLIYRWSVKELEHHIKGTLKVKQEMDNRPAQQEVVATTTTKCTYCGSEESGPRIAVTAICVSCSGLLVDTRRASGGG